VVSEVSEVSPSWFEPVDQRLKALLQQKTPELEITIHSLQIIPDHVHRFVEADPTRCVAEIVNRLNGSTSHFLRTELVSLRSRVPTLSSRSYYAGTVGSVSEAVVRKYIASQKRE
jgi:putative transposase